MPTTAIITRGHAVVPNSYIVQLAHGPAPRAASAVDLVSSLGGSVQQHFEHPDIFHGMVVTLRKPGDATALAEMAGVKNIRPNRVIRRSEEPVQVQPAAQLARRAGGGSNQTNVPFHGQTNYPHKMTGLDKLHKAGIKGKGITVGIIDSGVDYTHPALGGCFGPKCKTTKGYDFVGDAYVGDDRYSKSSPLATCASGGHGTHVSGKYFR